MAKAANLASAKRARRTKKKRAGDQETFGFMRWGGARKGAGAKRKAARQQVPHLTRGRVTRHEPLHITVRLVDDAPSLRTAKAREVFRRSVDRANKRGVVRVVHYSVQSNHIHMIVESADRESLTSGLRGLLVSLARTLNTLWNRVGQLIADRYHDQVLKTPTQVRNALNYVLNNHKHHRSSQNAGLDAHASGAWFDGWRSSLHPDELVRAGHRVVANAHSWLLSKGWRRQGLLAS